MPGNFDDIIREVLGGALKPSTSPYDTLNTPNADEESFNKFLRGKTVPPLRPESNLGNVILAGDVLPFTGARPSVNTLPTPSEQYLPLWSGEGWRPGASDLEKLNGIIKMPAND